MKQGISQKLDELSQMSLHEVLLDCILVDEIVGDKVINHIADWLLKPEIMQEYKPAWTQPELPIQLGSCWILLKLNVREDSIFRPAMILPLVWKKDEAKPDERLPKGLLELAGKVKEVIGGDETSKWTLHSGLSSIPDLSDLMPPESSQSAWFALYAGLRLALDGLLPNPKIFATGAWNDAVQEVSGLEEKAKVALDWGAEKLFIPEQCNLTGDWPTDFIQKVKNDTKPEKALMEYLSYFADEPNEFSDSDLLNRFYAYIKLAGKNERAQDFYIRKITPRLVSSCNDTKKNFSRYINGTLVAWVSGGWEIILNDVLIFEVSKVILLLDGKRFEKAAVVLRQKLEKQNIQVDIRSISPKFLEEKGYWSLLEDSASLSQNKKPLNFDSTLTPLIFDLTLGSVVMSLTLLSIPDIQPLFLYWEKQVDENNILVPGSSIVRAWNKKM